MDDRTALLKQKMDRLLVEAAEVSVELDRDSGLIQEVPHYSVIEARAHELGQQLSREIQQRQMAETVALERPKAPCPACGTRCDLKPKKRPATSIDGELDLIELYGDCPVCRRAFFPAEGTAGA